MKTAEFDGFLSGVASRLRHDLKGGLITLRMGLEALPDEEELKPLLVERALHLEALSDKLVLLLRMGQMNPQPVRLSALMGEFRTRVSDLYPHLTVCLSSLPADLKPSLDGDALVYTMMEIAENAHLAGARQLAVEASLEDDGQLQLTFADDGTGVEQQDPAALAPLGVSGWGRSGLGLAIAQRCVQGHGGRMELLSRGSGSGLTVNLTLGLRS